MPPRNLPKDIASVADVLEGARLSAPAAQRNVAPLTALLRHHAPTSGRALEIASGTGEHALAFAGAFPGLTWQPTDLSPERLASIDAWAATDPQETLLPAIELDACTPGWGAAHPDHALILLVNLLHLISEPEAKTLIAELPKALAPKGRAILYGPFLRDGEATSDGDARFHAALQQADAETGYKDDFDVIDWLHDAGLTLVDVVEMPANNLAIVAQRD